ncbi:MAG: toll/interleukin-1 receptor domain-containing protein [Hymenobacter sp.]|nr:MAG: toll/interleukin-1 receptor domain-containing protein [Hymenobacter sp.]
MAELPTIFLSYCWANEAEAEQIYRDLQAVGITVRKDSHQMAYRDSISQFMQSIRSADYALLLLSEQYLKSQSCMYEVGQLFQEQDAHRRLLPVLLDGTRIHGPRERLTYVRYWQEQQKMLQKELRPLDPANAAGLYAQLRIIQDIAGHIDGFLSTVTDMQAITFSKLRQRAYRPLLLAAGFQDITHLYELLNVFTLKGHEEREMALDVYLTRFPADAFYHGVKAGICRDAGRINQARFHYEQAIELRPQHTEALNNLGELYRTRLNDPATACTYYERALAVDPKMTIARLNLGYVHNEHFKKSDAARAQYEAILAYEPECAPAHLSIANILKICCLRTSQQQIEWSQDTIPAPSSPHF